MSSVDEKSQPSDTGRTVASGGARSAIPGEPIPAKAQRLLTASQVELVWWNFTRHKAAVAGGIGLILLYLVGLFAEFFSPYDPHERYTSFVNSPPQRVHFVDQDGSLRRPFVYRLEEGLDLKTFRRTWVEDTSRRYEIRFFLPGWKYKLWNAFRTDWHFLVVEQPATLFLLGTDALGRDLLSRILHASRISLSIGLVGVVMSFVIGCVLGAISGYFSGAVDTVIQRIIEFLISVPSIPLWMGLSAALPAHWPVVRVYFAITIILSLVSWTSLARVVRGKFLELREADFVMAARLGGATERRVIFRHMLPGFASYLIVDITLAIPGMILGETALSFLGLGLRPPALSWGVLLKDAQNIQTIAIHPWLLLPALWVILAVLFFNFVGDGLRDAADPYKTV